MNTKKRSKWMIMVAEDGALGYKQRELRGAFQPMIDLRKQEEEETKKIKKEHW